MAMPRSRRSRLPIEVHVPASQLRIFIVPEAEADAIRAAFVQQGEASAAIDLRRLFPGITYICAGAGVRSHDRLVEAAAQQKAAPGETASDGSKPPRYGTRGRWLVLES